jgi:predicted transcriptional regulator
MAFNIMDLFGPGALNRLLQPAQQQGVQNFLANPAAVQQQPQMAPQLPAPINVGQVPQVAQADPWAGMREADVKQIDPMMTGATHAQPVAARPSPFAGLGINKESLNDIFTGWAMGSTPSESIAKGAQLVAANRGTRQNVNQTVAWLKGKGMDEQQAKMLASSPPALNEYLKTMAAGADPQKALELQKTQLEIEKLRNPTEKLTSDQQEYKYAVDQGFKGNFVDYQRQMKEAGRSQVNVDTGVKLPSGFRWIDANNQAAGVEPIPGGPANQLPGELAARIGLADSWLKNDLPTIKKSAESGDVTGWYDRYQAGNNQSSPQATTYRKIQSGVEVLSRLLSGAGMTQVEIDEKAARYQPTYTDDAKSLSDKIDQLAQEIQATRDSAMQGRGGPVRGQQAPATGGVVDYQEYFKGQ